LKTGVGPSVHRAIDVRTKVDIPSATDVQVDMTQREELILTQKTSATARMVFLGGKRKPAN
jgi:hypothetical protein